MSSNPTKEKNPLRAGEQIQLRINVMTGYPIPAWEGKLGTIMEHNDSVHKDYKVDFENGWVGYFNRNQLKRA